MRESYCEVTEMFFLCIWWDDCRTYFVCFHTHSDWIKIFTLLNIKLEFHWGDHFDISFFYWRFFRSWPRFTKAVAITGVRDFNIFGLLRPPKVRKIPFFIAFKKVLGVGLKHHPCKYWIVSVFVISMVIMACALFWIGFVIGIPHSPSSQFLCTFNIHLESLRILIAFWSEMAM